MNNVSFVGRLCADPEMRTTSTGKAVCSFRIAVNRRFKSADESAPSADFFSCSAWEKDAEFLCNYGTKGRLVELTGRIENRKYTDRDGVSREVSEVTTDSVSLLDKPKDDAVDRVTAPRPQSADDEYDPFADE